MVGELSLHGTNRQTYQILRVFVCRIEDFDRSKVCLLDTRRTPTLQHFIEQVAQKLGIDGNVQDAEVLLDGRHIIDSIDLIQEGDQLALRINQEHPSTEPSAGSVRKSTAKPSRRQSHDLRKKAQTKKKASYNKKTEALRRSTRSIQRRDSKEEAKLSLKRPNRDTKVVEVKHLQSSGKKRKCRIARKPLKKTKKIELSDDPYPVGQKFFVRDSDGFEYPVRIMPPNNRRKVLDECERYVNWIGYKDFDVVRTAELLPCTKEREENFEECVVPQLERNNEPDLKEYSSGEEEDMMEEMQNTRAKTPTGITVSSSVSSMSPTAYEVGKTYYVMHSDGIEYPVELVRFCNKCKCKSKKCRVTFNDYRKTEWTVNMTDLLPATAKRQSVYQAHVAFAKQQWAYEAAKKRERKHNAQLQAKSKRAKIPKRRHVVKKVQRREGLFSNAALKGRHRSVEVHGNHLK